MQKKSLLLTDDELEAVIEYARDHGTDEAFGDPENNRAAVGNYVLVRSITALDLTGQRGEMARNALDAGDRSVAAPIACEVVAIGDEVPEGRVEVGQWINNVAAFVTPVNGMRRTSKYAHVHYNTITGGFDPRLLLRKAQAEALEREAARARANGLG